MNVVTIVDEAGAKIRLHRVVLQRNYMPCAKLESSEMVCRLVSKAWNLELPSLLLTFPQGRQCHILLLNYTSHAYRQGYVRRCSCLRSLAVFSTRKIQLLHDGDDYGTIITTVLPNPKVAKCSPEPSPRMHRARNLSLLGQYTTPPAHARHHTQPPAPNNQSCPKNNRFHTPTFILM